MTEIWDSRDGDSRYAGWRIWRFAEAGDGIPPLQSKILMIVGKMMG